MPVSDRGTLRGLTQFALISRESSTPVIDSKVESWVVGEYVRKAGRKANLPASGAHRLRHTFCSHLAMRGAPARAIQELAGHQDLMTTQRYMHLSPTALDGAIRLLERGDILETAAQGSAKSLS